MAKTFTYQIAVELTNDTQSDVKKILGKFAKEVNKNTITIEFDPEMDTKGLMKKIEEIQKSVPEITVQVKYDILEKATEQAKAKLKELQKGADLSILEDSLKKATAEFDNLYKEFKGNNSHKRELNELAKTISSITTALGESPKGKTILSQLPKDVQDTINKLERLEAFERSINSAQPIHIVSEEEIKKQMNLIAELEGKLTELENQGASPRKTTDLSQIRRQMEEVSALVNEKLQIQVDNTSAVQNIEQVNELLKALEEKQVTVRITGTNTVAEKMGKFVEEFKSITQQMESAFGGEVLSNKGKAGLEASIKVIQKVREEEKTLQSSLKEMNADLDKSLNVTSDSNLEGKIESLVKQVQTAKRGLKNISLGIEIDEAKKAKFLADLKNLSDILDSIPSEKDIHINVITDGEDKAQKLIYSEEQLEEGFTKLQAIAKQFGNFNLTKNVDKEAFANLLDQYQKYVNYGGKRPVEDLTESSKAAEKLSKAYAELAGQAGVMTPVKVKVEPEIDPQEFADKVTNLLSEVSAKIKVSGIFADNVDSNLSSLKSLSDINISRDGFNALNKLINNLANNKDERIKNLLENLTKIREILNANLGKYSLVRVLQDMVNQTDGLKSLVSILKDYEKTQKAIETVKTVQTNPNEIFEVNQQYIQEWDKYINEREKYLAIGEKQAKQVAEEAKKSAKETEESIKKITFAFDELDKKGLSQYAQSDIDKLKNDLAEVQAEIQKVGAANISDESRNKINEIAEELKKVKANATEASKSFKQLASSSDIDSMMNKMQNWLSSNKKLSDSTRQAVQNLMSTLNLGSTTKEQLSGISKEFTNIQRNAKAAGETGRTFFDIWKQGMTNVVRYLSTFTSIYRIIGYVRESLTTIKDLDYALVDLRKTAHMTSTEFEQFYLSSNNVAKQMGVTTQAIIEQASSWSRLGYNTAETASAMAALSSQFASISPGMETDTAQTGLVSIMKAWDVDVDRVKRDIMDNINTLGNNFALTNEDIIQGMERAGATLSAIGMDIQGSFALFTGAQEVIQNAETVGTAIKTLSLRIRGYDEETEELSDDVVAATGKVADLTKVASNNFAGVSLWADAAQTEYRSLVDYLGDIAEIWDEIDAKSRTQLLENLFGKRGASVGSAILGNFEQVRSALEAMEEAAGSSDREMGIVEQSIEYKLNALKQTWVGTLQNIIDRGDLGKIVDGLTAISEVLGNIVNVLGVSGTLATGGGIIASIFAVKDFNNIVNKFREFSAIGKTINVLDAGMRGMAGHKRLIEELAKTTGTLTAEKTAELLATKGLDAQLVKDVLIKQGVSEETIQATLANTAFTASEEGATVGAFSLSAALKGLWASFAPFIVGGAIIAGFAAIATVIYKTKEANDELKKSAQELGEKYNSSKKELEDYKEEISQLRDTINDSSASYEETKEARERLLEVQNELIDKYGTERDAINEITEAVNGSSEAFDRLIDRQWQEARNQFNNQNLKGIDWLNRAIHGASDNVGVMLAEMENVNRVVRGTSSDFEALNKVASQLGYAITFDEATSQIEVTADNAYDLYERLLDVQKILEENGASNKTLSSLNKQITDLKDTITEYDDFYNQFVLNERIFGTGYEDNWIELTKSYKEYQQALLDEDNEEVVASRLNAIREQYKVLQQELVDNNETDAVTNSILNAFKDAYPELQSEIDSWNLESQLTVEVDMRNSVNASNYAREVTGLNFQELQDEIAEYKKYLDSELKEAQKIGVDLSKTVYGNIDTDERQVLTWTDNKIDEYKEALLSWKNYWDRDNSPDDEWLEGYRGTYSTVDARRSEFDGVEIAFTPMLQTENGPVYLSAQTVEEYLYAVLEKANGDYSAENILKIDADTEGILIDGQKIHNLIAGIGEEAILADQAMHFSGANGSIKTTERELERLYGEVGRYNEAFQDALNGLAPSREINDRGDLIRQNAEKFSSAAQLLNMANQNIYDSATDEMQQAYTFLKQEADFFGVSIQDLINLLYKYNQISSSFMLSNDIKNSIANLSLGASNSQQETAQRILSDYAAKLDAEEQEVWIRFAASYQGNWWNFIKDFEAELERIRTEVANEDLINPMSITETVESINTQLKPALDSLGDVYTQVLSGKDTLIPDALGSIDLIEQVEKVKKELDSLNEIDGIEVDYAPFEHLVEVLQDVNSTGVEVQDAFNDVATSIVNAGTEGSEAIRTLTEALSDFGITNAPVVAISRVYESTEELAEAGLDLVNANEEILDAWVREQTGAEDTAAAVAYLKMQQILLNENALNESESITELIRLAGVAGVATDALIELASIQAQIDRANAELEVAIKEGNSGRIATVQDIISQLQVKAADAQARFQDDISNVIVQSYEGSKDKGSKSAGSAGKDAGKAYVDGFKEELSKLKEQYDRGEIDLKTYLARYRDLIEKYFGDTEKYAEERAEALHDYLEEMKGYYDSAISGVTTLIDHKIKGIQKEKDAALKAIEEERKAATAAYEQRIEEIDKLVKEKNKEIKAYEKVIKQIEKQKKAIEKQKKEIEKQKKAFEDQKKTLDKQKTLIQKSYIDPLNEEIDLMQKANEERDRQLKLQTDLYELERLQNQRTQLVKCIANLHRDVMIIKVAISVKGIWECRDRGKTEFRFKQCTNYKCYDTICI